MHLEDQDEEIYLPTDIMINIKSPKIIFDEFLLGERVLDKDLPALFLLDMGSWTFKNKLYSLNLENLTDFLIMGVDEEVAMSQRGTYESLDMRFMNLSLHYTPYSSSVFLDKSRKYEAFKVFENMNMGL